MTTVQEPYRADTRLDGDIDDTTVFGLLDFEERELLHDAPQNDDGPESWLDLVADAGFVRRSTVLARSGPLHRLTTLLAWQPFPDDLYDVRTMALAAVEAVVSRQGMEREATTGDVVGFLEWLARGSAPGRDEQEYTAVARFVLRELLNDQQGGAAFSVPYSDFRQGHHRGDLVFRLLEEGFGRLGQPVLRASVEAINLVLVGLDQDLGDQQAARDVALRRQVASGRWGQAEQSAAESLKLSLVLAERVRLLLRETERDCRSVDWAQGVPTFLQEAREHLKERLEVENGLMEWLRSSRDDTEDPGAQETFGRILRLLVRAHRRHAELLSQVIGAGPAFLRAQAEQCFRPVPRLASVDLEKDVLDPLLGLDASQAREVAGAFADAVSGPVASRIPRLRDLWALLLAPVRESSGVVEDDGDIEFVTAEHEDAGLFSEDDYARARAALNAALLGPVRLSALIAEAGTECRAADLVALSVLYAFAPDPDDGQDGWSDPIDLVGDRLLVIDDGTGFEHGRFGGSDLLVLPATVAIPGPQRGTWEDGR
ncbi:hypothetical protein [Kitasatospora herbaricolor]|uniref:hypothetical protein n=1 Tax=Kitasatospora herbaricolor TaxID=68217 RepID=UPI0036DB222D